MSIASSLIKDLYTPKGFINHAASLRHTFVHCGRFSTAATRRCMDSVSVPLVGIRLSPPLRVIALVVRYTTNKLIRIRPIKKRLTPLLLRDHQVLLHLSMGYSWLFGTFLIITTPFATNNNKSKLLLLSVRLACLIHAASIHPELGSNSTQKRYLESLTI